MLVWDENATRPYLNTMDSYLFTGKEINGNITVGIGESGDDVDYINAMKLYKVESAPAGYKVEESYNGKVYAYREVEPGIAIDNSGKNVTTQISTDDGNYWVGEKGDYIDITLNLSRENLLIIRGIYNPPNITGNISTDVTSPPVTLSTIWLYVNISGEWIKIGELKVRHNLHTNVINLKHIFRHVFKNKIELRFVMRDRNSIDFISIAHKYRVVRLMRVPLRDGGYGYKNISRVYDSYIRLNPGDFIGLNFEGKGDGLYLLKIYGFYFNIEKIGKGIGIVNASAVNITEAELQTEITSNKSYVLLPLLYNYSGVCIIMWFVNDVYVPGTKPMVRFGSGDYELQLLVIYADGYVQHFSLQFSAC